MKSILPAMILLCAYESFAQRNQLLPDTWSRNLVIEFLYGGSTNESKTHGRITYDSCTLKFQSGNKAPVQGYYKMKDSDRKAIIRRLHELKADQINGEADAPVSDRWTQSIRIGDINLSAGPSVKMTETDRQRFGQVYQYLEEFVIKKTKAGD